MTNVQSHLERIIGAKESLKSAISSKGVSVPSSASIDDYPALVRSIPQEGGGSATPSSGGVIDVEELPTSGIDENAVYRLTENVIVRPLGVFLVLIQGLYFTLEQYLENQGIYPETMNVFDVEELPPIMEPSDIDGFTVLNVYVNRADGKSYMYVAEYGMAMSAGYMLGDPSFDKGSTENISEETEVGFYTTFEETEEFSRYFVRENFEWKEITAYINTVNQYKLDTLSYVTGDVTKQMFAASQLLCHEDITEICEEWFLKRDGTYVKKIESYQFARSYMVEAVIPSCVTGVENLAFEYCNYLETVTFKGTPNNGGVGNNAFGYCKGLTTINVPWSEGEISNAPWGAPSDCVINYNCKMEG